MKKDFLSEIKCMNGLNNVSDFFTRNKDLSVLDENEFHSLKMKLAKQNASNHLDSYWQLVVKEEERRNAPKPNSYEKILNNLGMIGKAVMVIINAFKAILN